MLKDILNDSKFNTFFSIMLGIGLICILRPVCSGSECTIDKPPSEKDFDKYVYKLGSNCYKFTTNITQCPKEGAIEAFQENIKEGYVGDIFLRRKSQIGPVQCE